MNSFRTILILLALSGTCSPLVGADFAHEVVPILKEHCTECHGGDKAKGGFSLNTRSLFLEDDAAEPGNAAKSYFLELIEETDPEVQMPPEKKPRVPAEQIAVLKKWVDEGLAWEAGFSFGAKTWEPPLEPVKVTLPPALSGRDHPVDRILDQTLPTPPQPASDAAFLRRVTLDAIGLLPEPEELEAFLADTDPEKRTRKIDELLANDIAYADHWLTTWNDLLRNDYTGTGFITKGRTQITSWLYAALRENMPYDQFVRELISPTPDSAGFINGIKWRGDVNASQTCDIQFAQNISQVFLGINMKCASCHDSFIDRWKLSEAYNLAAIFSEQPLELNRCDKPTGEMATPKWIFPSQGDVDPAAPKAERLKQLAGLMTHPDNGRFTRTVVNRIWERLMGRGIVHPVDSMDSQPWNEDLLDYLAVRFAEDGHDLRKFIRLVMTSNAYQSQCEILDQEAGEDYTWSGPGAKRMTAEQFLDAIWQITGTHPEKPDANVDRALPDEDLVKTTTESVFEAAPVSAKWIWHEGETDKKSWLRKTVKLDKKPVAARLMATCDNYFTLRINGEDVAESKVWMNPVYIDISKWLKQGTNTFSVVAGMTGGASGFIGEILIHDGEKQTVISSDKTWQARRAKGEWAAAKELHPHGAGPWGKLLKPQFLASADLKKYPAGLTPPVRAALVKNDFLMRSLGRPHRDQVVTTRPSGLTTLQAIDLANGDILSAYLSKGAEKLMREKSGYDLGEWLYRFALSRTPTDDEKQIISEVLGDGSDPRAVEDLMWLVFMQPEFQMIR
ncbi:MAG: DUF1549 domain-containing protein [Verrucomicrobiales bacterium]|nr:DUF1549 domain-containing protein [Verrucomicrobiales bacterium]